MSEIKNILIIGGTGDFGSFYAKLLKKNGFEVFISSTNAERGKAYCKKAGFNFFGGNFEAMDVVIVSVPNKFALKIISDTVKKIKKGTLLFDLCSVKSFVVPELEKLKGQGFELASIHPMHGPRISSIANYPVVLIPIEGGKKLEEIKSFFNGEKARLIESGAKEHDKTLAIVQGLTHYAQFVSAAVLREMKVDLKKTMDFSSPNYALFLSVISRVILQNPEMYSQIQLSNPYNKEVREVFSKKTLELEKICEKEDFDGLKQKIIGCAKVFDSGEEVLLDSDRAVGALKSIFNSLKEHTGDRFLIENLNTHNFHYGVVEKVTSKEVTILEGKRRVVIALSKIRLINKKEVLEWRKNNILEIGLDYSFLTNEAVDAETIAQIFSKIVKIDVSVIDEYKSEKLPIGMKAITIKTPFFADDDKKVIDAKIKELIKNLGFELR
ncbi:MAG: prephenate dehydrogenase/arogenate dehydrogenase family protein [Candidatus Diapherotrites archaeon]|nr:prephenate dehydrogenase/arogenate dehydrogenase family protein [Candidatus Diapherotrites archaeon]